MRSKTVKAVRCAIYTRVSTEAGLEQDFNSRDAQYDAAQAYIRSQAHAGWTLIRSPCVMRRPNGRCSLSGLVWPSPDPTFTDFRPSAHPAATASRRSSRHHRTNIGSGRSK